MGPGTVTVWCSVEVGEWVETANVDVHQTHCGTDTGIVKFIVEEQVAALYYSTDTTDFEDMTSAV